MIPRTTIVTPMRFVSGVIGVWVAARVFVLLPFAATGVAVPADPVFDPRAAVGKAVANAPLPIAAPAFTTVASTSRPHPVRSQPVNFAIAAVRRSARSTSPLAMPGPARPTDMLLVAMHDPAPRPAPETMPVLSPSGIVSPPPPPEAQASSRWSGNLYLYRRGDGTAALASGGQLGGSQAGARIAWRLNRDGPARFAAAARISTPLDDTRGAEAAVGMDWHPLPGQPLRVSVERRVDLGGAGRDAWSAYAAGGFYREPRPGLVVDGYAQAGVVGARRRDLFADAALRGGARRQIGEGRSLTLGGGVWGAAQPRVARLDIGPRVALGLPIAGTAATLAAEWRIRVAGDASPRAGLAITLASDF